MHFDNKVFFFSFFRPNLIQSPGRKKQHVKLLTSPRPSSLMLLFILGTMAFFEDDNFQRECGRMCVSHDFIYLAFFVIGLSDIALSWLIWVC